MSVPRLRLFARETPNGALDVGIRVLGAEATWNNVANQKEENAAKIDTQNLLTIQRFTRKPFEKIVDQLKPVGALTAASNFVQID